MSLHQFYHEFMQVVPAGEGRGEQALFERYFHIVRIVCRGWDFSPLENLGFTVVLRSYIFSLKNSYSKIFVGLIFHN